MRQDPRSHVCPCSPHTLWVVDVEVSELGDVSRGPSGVSAFPRRIKHLEDEQITSEREVKRFSVLPALRCGKIRERNSGPGSPDQQEGELCL